MLTLVQQPWWIRAPRESDVHRWPFRWLCRWITPKSPRMTQDLYPINQWPSTTTVHPVDTQIESGNKHKRRVSTYFNMMSLYFPIHVQQKKQNQSKIPSGDLTELLKIAIYSWLTYWKLWFSMAMLVSLPEAILGINQNSIRNTDSIPYPSRIVGQLQDPDVANTNHPHH